MSTPEDILARLAMPKRLEALRQSGLMDSAQEEDFNRVTRLVQAQIACEVCLVTLVDDNRQFFKAAIGLPEPVRSERQTPLSHSLCQYVVANETPLVVEDARSDTRVADNLAVKDLNVVAYLGMPIHGPDGEVLGSLCVIDRRPRAWTESEQAQLRDFSHLLENVINARAYARDALRAANSNAVLAREYNHRIKNSFAVSAGLVRAAGRNAQTVEELVRDCTNRFASLGRAQDLIMGERDRTDLRHVVEAVLTPFTFGANFRPTGSEIGLTAAQITPLALLLHELATNSVKYGALRDGCDVEVRWEEAAPEVKLIWREMTILSEGQSLEGGFGTRVLEVAARQLGGQMTRTHEHGLMTVATMFPLGNAREDETQPPV